MFPRPGDQIARLKTVVQATHPTEGSMEMSFRLSRRVSVCQAKSEGGLSEADRVPEIAVVVWGTWSGVLGEEGCFQLLERGSIVRVPAVYLKLAF